MISPAGMDGRTWRKFQEQRKRKDKITYVLKSTKTAIQLPPKSQEA
jgi:hypothetical protein